MFVNILQAKMKTPFILSALLFLMACTESKTANSTNPIAKKKIKTNSIKIDSISTIEPKITKQTTLFEIAGNYILEDNDTDCKFDLSLYYKNDQLFYQLHTNTRKLTDKAEIELNEKKDGYYITFNNIEWSENEGALDDDGEQIDKELVLPTTVQGVLYKDKISIQNTGNAMNYYVKIGECDLKFIHLIRQ